MGPTIEEIQDAINAAHNTDSIHGLSRGEVADLIGTKNVGQEAQSYLMGLGYRPSYRTILQFGEDGEPLMAQKKAGGHLVYDETGTPIMERATKSVCYWVHVDRTYQPPNASSSVRSTNPVGISKETKERLAGMDLVGKRANDLEDELGVQFAARDLADIAANAGLKVGYTTERHGHYKTFKPLD